MRQTAGTWLLNFPAVRHRFAAGWLLLLFKILRSQLPCSCWCCCCRAVSTFADRYARVFRRRCYYCCLLLLSKMSLPPFLLLWQCYCVLLLSLLILVAIVCDQCATPAASVDASVDTGSWFAEVPGISCCLLLHMPLHDCSVLCEFVTMTAGWLLLFLGKIFWFTAAIAAQLQMQLSLYAAKCYVSPHNLDTCLRCAVASSLVNCCLLFPTWCYHRCSLSNKKSIDHCYPCIHLP